MQCHSIHELAPVTVAAAPAHPLTLSTIPWDWRTWSSNLTVWIRSNATPHSCTPLHRQHCQSYGGQSTLPLLPSFPTAFPTGVLLSASTFRFAACLHWFPLGRPIRFYATKFGILSGENRFGFFCLRWKQKASIFKEKGTVRLSGKLEKMKEKKKWWIVLKGKRIYNCDTDSVLVQIFLCFEVVRLHKFASWENVGK